MSLRRPRRRPRHGRDAHALRLLSRLHPMASVGHRDQPAERDHDRADPQKTDQGFDANPYAPRVAAERLAEGDENVTVQRGVDRRFRHRILPHAVDPLLRPQHGYELLAAPYLELALDGRIVRTLDVAKPDELEVVPSGMPRLAGPHRPIELRVIALRDRHAEDEQPETEMRDVHPPLRARDRRTRRAASQTPHDGV